MHTFSPPHYVPPFFSHVNLRHVRATSSLQYIALEKLEATYKSCNLVANICVHASPDAKQPMAIIIPHEPNLRHALESNSALGVDKDEHLGKLCHDKRVSELVLKELNAVGRKNGFKALELLQAVVVTDEEWTPENGLVTAAQKLQRKKVAEHYEKEIKVRASFILFSSIGTFFSFFREEKRERLACLMIISPPFFLIQYRRCTRIKIEHCCFP